MSELKNLLMQDDNLVLASQLSRAVVDYQAMLVRRFYSEIDRKLHEKIMGLPKVDSEWAHLMEEEEIRKYITHRHGSQSGIYYPIAGNAWLAVAWDDRLWCGVNCENRDDSDMYERLKEALVDVQTKQSPDKWDPWWTYVDEMLAWSHPSECFLLRDSNETSLKILSGDVENRAKVVEEIANTLALLWEKIKKDGIVD